MVGGVSHGGIDSQLQQRRAALAGKAGAAGLVSNGRTTAIALFASMGGLIYGYNQGEFRRPKRQYITGRSLVGPHPTLHMLRTVTRRRVLTNDIIAYAYIHVILF